MNEYEYALATTAAEQKEIQEQTKEQIAAKMAREIIRIIAKVFQDDKTNGEILLQRFAGLSYSEIAAKINISREATFKRTKNIEQKFPELKGVLTNNNIPFDKYVARNESDIIERLAKEAKLRRKLTKWLKRKN